MDTREAAQRWAREWQRAWVEHDADRVAALYAPAAFFLSAPFRDSQDPREYALQAFAEEDSAEPWFGEPLVDGDRAAVEWRATIHSEGNDFTLAGTSLLRFRDDGLASSSATRGRCVKGSSHPADSLVAYGHVPVSDTITS